MHLAGLQWSAVPSVANTNPTQNVSTFVAAVPKGLSFLELFNDSTGTFHSNLRQICKVWHILSAAFGGGVHTGSRWRFRPEVLGGLRQRG